jgi:hypothetical protein
MKRLVAVVVGLLAFPSVAMAQLPPDPGGPPPVPPSDPSTPPPPVSDPLPPPAVPPVVDDPGQPPSPIDPAKLDAGKVRSVRLNGRKLVVSVRCIAASPSTVSLRLRAGRTYAKSYRCKRDRSVAFKVGKRAAKRLRGHKVKVSLASDGFQTARFAGRVKRAVVASAADGENYECYLYNAGGYYDSNGFWIEATPIQLCENYWFTPTGPWKWCSGGSCWWLFARKTYSYAGSEYYGTRWYYWYWYGGQWVYWKYLWV